MKKINLALIIVLAAASPICAQNYQLNFSGTGLSTTVDSVKIENLTQCKVMDINGSDILNLVSSIGVDNLPIEVANKVHIYPNPMVDLCQVDVESIAAGDATIRVYDLAGKNIMMLREFLPAGNHTFQLKGLSKGVYTLKVETENYCYNAKIVSIGSSLNALQIIDLGVAANTSIAQKNDEFKKGKASVDMQYNDGDLLKLIGKSGTERTVIMLVATESQAVVFPFMACTDANGNSYAVVQIGSQWWMAENLNAGTYALIATPQVSGTKFCMDINGQADTNCPMGGLYEWANLMQGGAPCNGSGAPPDDACSTPVKGLCPNGWHIPSHYEWTTLERNSGSSPTAFPYNTSTISLLGVDEGGNLKATCTNYWWAPNAGATNTTGFSGLPGGDTWNGVFEDYGQSAYFWTSTETLFMSWVHALNYSLTLVGRSSYAVESGFSCRCVKD